MKPINWLIALVLLALNIVACSSSTSQLPPPETSAEVEANDSSGVTVTVVITLKALGKGVVSESDAGAKKMNPTQRKVLRLYIDYIFSCPRLGDSTTLDISPGGDITTIAECESGGSI